MTIGMLLIMYLWGWLGIAICAIRLFNELDKENKEWKAYLKKKYPNYDWGD